MAEPWNFRGADLTPTNNGPSYGPLFGPGLALGVSNSSLGVGNNVKYPNLTTIEAAPFTEEDIAKIMGILSKCPEDISLSRVFKQHPELGTCWFDSFVMMTFENPNIKPYILPFVEVAMRILLKNDIHDLGYCAPIEKTAAELENNRRWYGPEASTHNPRPFHKLAMLVSVFKRITNAPDTFETYQWNFFAHLIQKYILLGYLFMKEPDQPTLGRRRNSINSASFDYLHCSLRTTIGARGRGAEDYSIRDVFIPFSELLQFVTKGRFTIVPFRPMETLPRKLPHLRPYQNTWKTPMSVDKTEGYYIVVLRTDNYSFGHVLSLYKCGERWTIYNNDVGIQPLGEDISRKITRDGIKGINYTIHKNDVQYDITYGNDTTDTLNADLCVEQSTEKVFEFSEASSYKLVRLTDAVAPAGMGAAGGEGGGRRLRKKTKKQRRRKNKSRKH
jgi:hypothetical protein